MIKYLTMVLLQNGIIMALTDFQIQFRNTLLKITDDIPYIYGFYLQARTDDIRQQIIDGINNGKIKTEEDVFKITIKQAKGYKLLAEQGGLPEFMAE